MARAADILALARAELGVKESPAGSNCVKYNTAYYGREVRDTAEAQFPWCVVFQWWLFRAAGAPELFYGGGRTASCKTLLSYAKAHGLFVSGGYVPGDLVFLRFSTKRTSPEHIGIVKEVRADGSLVTIEGNTGLGDDANGGQVQQRVRSAWQAVGGYRPKYDTEEDEDMNVEALTEEQLLRLAERMQAALARRPVSDTLAPELEEAKALGITDGSNPNAFCTRAQAAVMVKRAAK